MIKQLKKRVVIAAMISVTVVLIFIIGAINALNYQSITKDVDDILREIHNNGGAFPEEKDDNGSDLHAPFEIFPNSQEQPYKDRYFTMIYDGNTFSHIQNTFNHDKAKELGNKIINQRRNRGSLMDLTGIYRYYLDTKNAATERFIKEDGTVYMAGLEGVEDSEVAYIVEYCGSPFMMPSLDEVLGDDY